MPDNDATQTAPGSSAGASPPQPAGAAASAGGEAGTPSDWLPTERISWFSIPEEGDLDPRVADLVRRQREKLGAPNNVVRVHAWRPDAMFAWLGLNDQITKGPSGLTRAEREMIGVVVSNENQCIF